MAMLPTDMGTALYEAYKKNPSIKATFSPGGPFDVLTDYPHPSAGLMSYFSSWGPDNELKLVKPDVVGIGSDTLGAVPLPVRYSITAGNSFSTPTVSGAVALYKSVHGRNVSSASIRSALKHTATRVKRKNGGGDESLFWAGAGLVNITAAIDLTTQADPIDFNFGASPITEYHKQIIIKNTGTKKQSYNVTHIPAQSVYLLEEGAPEKRLTVNSSMISAIPQNADEAATMSLYQNVFDLGEGTPDELLSPPSRAD
jgi:subtilisin family serine protease